MSDKNCLEKKHPFEGACMDSTDRLKRPLTLLDLQSLLKRYRLID